MFHVTSFTIAGLLMAILFVHMLRKGSFSKLWAAAAGSVDLAA